MKPKSVTESLGWHPEFDKQFEYRKLSLIPEDVVGHLREAMTTRKVIVVFDWMPTSELVLLGMLSPVARRNGSVKDTTVRTGRLLLNSKKTGEFVRVFFATAARTEVTDTDVDRMVALMGLPPVPDAAREMPICVLCHTDPNAVEAMFVALEDPSVRAEVVDLRSPPDPLLN